MKFKSIAAAAFSLMLGTTAAGAQGISGAGATFPAPLYMKWAEEARKDLGFEINYQSIGSGAGITQINNRTVDFGASDAPLDPVKLTDGKLIQVPMVMGTLVVIYNVPGVKTGELKLTSDIVADIYMGKITKWNDERIVKINQAIKLPNLAIAPVYRGDGSGTTWIFTQYLAKTNPTWASTVGSSTSVKWPAGNGARGNEGVSATVAKIPGGFGYTELSYAVQNRISMAQLQNADGVFVQPTDKASLAAGSNATWSADRGFAPDLINQKGPQTWPIVGATYLLLPRDAKDSSATARVVKFVQWAYAKGDGVARELHYVPIPQEVRAQVTTALKAQLPH